MIVRTLNQVSLNFGKGDIAINSGHIKKENDVNLGILGFFNQDPRTIGSKAKIREDMEEYPVVLTFSKIESVDSVIRMLENMRKLMLNKEDK